MEDDPVRALAERRRDTERRVASLRRQLQRLADEQALTTHDDEHDPEGVTIAYERAQLRGLLDSARAELAAVDRAGRRHREGVLDRCVRCGAAIGEQRRAALPTAVECVTCAGRPRRR